MEKKKKYNVRSAKNDGLQIPIQLQFFFLSISYQFFINLMTNFMGSNNMLETQQDSDTASSGSKLECSGVVDY